LLSLGSAQWVGNLSVLSEALAGKQIFAATQDGLWLDVASRYVPQERAVVARAHLRVSGKAVISWQVLQRIFYVPRKQVIFIVHGYLTFKN
jgi:hypothetical protein